MLTTADIDAAPSASDLASARALILAELPPSHATSTHPSLRALPPSKFSDLMATEHSRLASGAPPATPAIDLSRYEAQDAPTSTSAPDWRTALQRAYASSEYLSSRLTNLGLLETYGKNAWLIGNSQLEDLLRGMEREVADLKAQTDEMERIRRAAQESARGELTGLDEAWRRGVGSMLEVEVAAEGLRREILDRRRGGAQ